MDRWITAFAFLVLLLTCGCGDGSESTGGRRITLRTRATVAAQAAPSFTNAKGWTITLERAFVSTGPLYYFDGAPLLSSRRLRPSSRWAVLRALLPGALAYAHPGHYVPGQARGQMLTPWSVDLLGAENDLPDGEAVTGIVRSATFSFQPGASGPFAQELGPHVAILGGAAVKGGETRVFRAEIDAEDLVNAGGAPAVEGCPFVEAEMVTDGIVTLAIDLAVWFDQVGFETVPPSLDGSPVLMPIDSLARKELVRGMKAGNGYRFSYAPETSRGGT